MWDLTVSVSDHCLSFFLEIGQSQIIENKVLSQITDIKSYYSQTTFFTFRHYIYHMVILLKANEIPLIYIYICS